MIMVVLLAAAEILQRQWHRQSVKDGRVVFEPEPPGWFERRCALLQCSWFSTTWRDAWPQASM